MTLAARAYVVVQHLAAAHAAFTSDDAWSALHAGELDDRRAIANAFIRAERAGIVRNSGLGVYVRGDQAHRRWLAVWLSPGLGGSSEHAGAYAREVLAHDRGERP